MGKSTAKRKRGSTGSGRGRSFGLVAAVALSLIALGVAGVQAQRHSSASSPEAGDPWPASDLIRPEELVKELEGGRHKPVIVCVGFPVLYDSAHIPGARLEGPAREQDALAKLKQWARTAPRKSQIVIYCGCCPFRECPNIRPAYVALRQAGLTNVRVLDLESNFITDWMDKDYPITSER